jgi:hypothetical protein
MRGAEIGIKYKSYNVQNFDNHVNAVIDAHMKRYRNKLQTTAGDTPF